MKYNIILWGTGDRARRLVEEKFFDECNILGYVDTYKHSEYFMGCKVFSATDLKKVMEQADYLIIVNQYFAEIIEFCQKSGVDSRKIVITDNVQEPTFYDKFLNLKKVSERLYDARKDFQIKLVKINESDYRDKDRLVGTNQYSKKEYLVDYFRYRTFEFVANEIINYNIEGAVAELGVFRGTFAAIINEKFKNRKLYLFDTFEGFSEEEAEKEIEIGRCDRSFVSEHKLTSVQKMLDNMPYKDRCVVCKGLFPSSITEEAYSEKYAFVSIDVDFEESSYQGLKFFYPRLSEGGMIFMHDYNTFYLEGIKKAINRYESRFGIQLKKVPLADRAGTLVIIK